MTISPVVHWVIRNSLATLYVNVRRRLKVGGGGGGGGCLNADLVIGFAKRIRTELALANV